MSEKKVWFITGSSTGFGRELAEELLEQNYRVVATARKIETLEDLIKKYPENAFAVGLDVTNAENRKNAVVAAIERFGRVDVVVNNAGQGSLGAIEEFSSEQIERQFDVNCFGVIEMTRVFLPVLRRQHQGHIVNITSVGGLVSMGGFGLYCATKFAVEGFSEALRDEVKPFGINVTVVEPGAFRTQFAGDSNMRPEKHLAEYDSVIEPLRQYLYGNDGKQPGDPRKAAKAIVQAIETNEPPLRLMLGSDAYGLWEQKRAIELEEFTKWRETGENTAFDGAEMRAIGG